jgi:hypothetical protein
LFDTTSTASMLLYVQIVIRENGFRLSSTASELCEAEELRNALGIRLTGLIDDRKLRRNQCHAPAIYNHFQLIDS